MNRFRPYSRRELGRQQRAWARRNARLLLILVGGCALLLAAVTALIVATSPDEPPRWYLLGALHIGTAAAVFHLVHAAFLAQTGDAIWQVRGAWGEENTRDVLRRAKRRRVIWGWVDSITTQGGDVDHLVLLRSGGLVVLDSKWRNQVDRAHVTEIVRSAHRARGRAQGIAQTVSLRDIRGRRRGPGESLVVRPAVVLWGAAQHTVPEGTEIDGVAFVPGVRLLAWLRNQDGEPASKAAASDLLKALTEFRAQAWRGQGEGSGAHART